MRGWSRQNKATVTPSFIDDRHFVYVSQEIGRIFIHAIGACALQLLLA
jgi:hypothetical protein